MNVVLDTSVTVAWYLPETFAVPARQWQARIVAGEVHAMVPPLHYQEFANVLRTYVKRQKMEPELAADLYALHLDAPLDMVNPPLDSLLATALQFDATVYDGAFISLALLHECPLVTAERTTTPWVVKLKEQAVVIR